MKAEQAYELVISNINPKKMGNWKFWEFVCPLCGYAFITTNRQKCEEKAFEHIRQGA